MIYLLGHAPNIFDGQAVVVWLTALAVLILIPFFQPKQPGNNR